MGTFQNQNQDVLTLESFVVEDDWVIDIETSIRRTKYNKSPGTDVIRNEMLKLQPKLMVRVVLEMCRLVGRAQSYPKDWKRINDSRVQERGQECGSELDTTLYALLR